MKFVRTSVFIVSLAAIAACSNYDKTASTASTETVQTSSFAIATETTASTPPSTMTSAVAAPSSSPVTPSVLRVQSQTSTSTATVAQSTAEPTDTFPTRVSLSEAQKMIDAGKAVIVDVRSQQDYQAEHIKGAISIPLAQVVARMAELPKDKTIITYCT